LVRRTRGQGQSRGSFWVGTSYSLFKGLAERLEAPLKDLRPIYERAGFALHFRAYLSLLIFSVILSALLSFTASVLVHYFLLNYTLFFSVVLSLIVSFAASASVLAAYIAAPLYRSSRWRRLIDPALPHVANYMQALASAGLPVEAMFQRVAEADINPALTRFARLVVRNVKLFGMDVLTALRRAMEASPSASLTRLVSGLTGVVSTSGDLRSFLAYEGEALLRAQRDRLRRLIQSLSLLAEAYVGIVVVAPVVFIIMSVIFLMLGGTILGLAPDVLMMFFILVGIPVLVSIFLIILDSMLGGV